MKSISVFTAVIRKEYMRGKENFNKRCPIMEDNANDLFNAGEISITQLKALHRKLNYYKSMNEGRK